MAIDKSDILVYMHNCAYPESYIPKIWSEKIHTP